MDGSAVNAVSELTTKVAQTIEVGGKTYSTVKYFEVKPAEPKDKDLLFQAPPTLVLTTLSGLIDYLNANPDGISNGGAFGRSLEHRPERPTGARIIHVVSPTQVDVLSQYQADDANSRFCFVRAKIADRLFSWGQFVDRETFHIALQTNFAEKGDRGSVLSHIGSLSDEQKVEMRDDNVTQTVVARMGVVTVGRVAVPNPVMLAPYRSFPEIEPPVSKFILRIQPGNKCALLETEPGKWAVDTASLIQKYIEVALTGSVAKDLLVLR